jgi:hypothetical protein
MVGSENGGWGTVSYIVSWVVVLGYIVLLGLFTGFLYYDASTLQGRPYFVCTKEMEKWA